MTDAFEQWASIEGVIPDTLDGCVDESNEFALTAGRLYMVAKGFAAEIEALRWSRDSGPTPAPGLRDLLDRVESTSLNICARADTIAQIAHGALEVGTPIVDPEAVAAAQRHMAECIGSMDELESSVRGLAALTIGVGAVLPWSDAIARSDRAAVAALLLQPGIVHDLSIDQPELFSTTFEELTVELSGLFCRLGLDTSGAMEFRGSAEVPFTLTVKGMPRGDLHLSFETTYPVEPALLTARGWTEAAGVWVASYQAPLPMTLPAGLVADTLFRDLELTNVEDLSLSYVGW